MAIDLSNYVTVAERIAEFAKKYPDGSLQPADLARPFRRIEVDGQTFIAFVAAAYRSPDDPRPGIGTAWEPCPGKTPYTRDSELQNAETSAWGRAIVAALAADTRKSGVASKDEVRNRSEAEDFDESGRPYRRATLRENVGPEEVGRMRIAELAERLEAAGLSKQGSLKTLRERLLKHLEKSSPAVENAPPESAPSAGASSPISAGAASTGSDSSTPDGTALDGEPQSDPF